MRLVPIRLLVRQVQSDGRTKHHRRRPSLNPASELFLPLPFVGIVLEVRAEACTNGFVRFLGLHVKGQRLNSKGAHVGGLTQWKATLIP